MAMHCSPRGRRRGAVMVLVALLMVFLLGLLAFAVDLGYIVIVRAELQKAADAAALAGAGELLSTASAGNLDSRAVGDAAVASARGRSQACAQLNSAGGVNLRVPDGDIVVGYLDDPGTQASQLQPWSAGPSYPNTVQVTVRRDDVANGALPLMFARIFGRNTWTGNVTATATAARSYRVTGFRPGTTNNALLPIAIRVDLWNTFLQTGASPDGKVHDSYTAARPSSAVPSPGNVTDAADKIPEFYDVYPNDNAPGNFGLVCIGPDSSDDPTFSQWIDHGASPQDLASFGPDGLQATTDRPRPLMGGPGLKSNLVNNLYSIRGQARIIPLFSDVDLQGSNAYYTIVGFVGITVVRWLDCHGNKSQVAIQPMAVIEPTATTSDSSWSGRQFIYPMSPLTLVR